METLQGRTDKSISQQNASRELVESPPVDEEPNRVCRIGSP